MWSDLILNLLFIIGLNKATHFEYALPNEIGQDYIDDKWIVKDSKSVLWWFRYQADNLFGLTISKPLFTCVPCMSSVWGSVGYWVNHPLTNQSLAMWPVYVFALAGLGTISNRYIYGGH